MKKPLILTFFLAFLASGEIFAQTEPCFTDQLLQNNPQYANDVLDLRNNFQPVSSGSSRAVRTISVKVHVVYNTAAENVSQTLIDNMITIMTQDYRRQNPNAANTRPQFVSVATDAQIEFCLDQVIRVQTSEDCYDPSTETDKMKTASPSVDPTHFLNIWIVDLCGTSSGGVAGYAYYPTTGMHGSSVDGLVLDYQLGLGTSSHTASHEIGHYFGLDHTFAGCGSRANNCTDIPEQSAPNYGFPGNCAPTNTSCGSLDQSDNFMDYSTCPNMFTICQAGVMNSILSTRRVALLSSTGCSSGATGPTAAFIADKTSGCPGTVITFTDQSSGNPTSRSWSFSGGTPSSSSAQNPTITYNTSGTYNVSLTVTNASGNDIETKTAYITIASANALPLVEDFQTTTFVPAGWTLNNPDNGETWKRTTQTGGFGLSANCAYVDNFYYDGAGQKDWMLTPFYNFSGVSSARLKFDYAHARYSASFIDSLEIVYTTNCGATFNTLWKKGGSGLATTTDKTTRFIPTASQWKKDSIDLSVLAGQANVQFAFINISGYGNTILVDNINVYIVSGSNPAPVANFSGSPLSIPVGGIVNFTDLSTNSPTSWNWSFPGAVTTSSTQQNPSGIQYNAVGTYNVSLTATNSVGSNTATKSNYITVTNPVVGSCDTITNVGANDSLTLYGSDVWGFVSGHNNYGDLAKADKYTGVMAGSTVNSAIFYFGFAKFGNANSKVTAKVWNANGTGGSPGTQLAAQDILISSIAGDVTLGNLTAVNFTSPATITGDFFLGIEFTYAAGDTVGLVTTLDGFTTPPTAWEKFSTGQWVRFDNANSCGIDAAHVILPIVCTASSGPIPVASFSSNIRTVCEGQTISFTGQATNNPTTWVWTFTGGTPASSTTQNPIITYNNSGTYPVLLQVSNSSGTDTFYNATYITINDIPAGNISVTHVDCNGGSTGVAALTVTGGTSPFTLIWSDGSTSQNISNLPAGIYSVTVTDSKGCSSTVGRSVNEPPVLTATITVITADCGVANGRATANPSGGTSPYAYSWSNGGTAQDINGLATGAYSVTVTDNKACQVIQTFQITNTGAPSVVVSSQDILCFGQNTGSVTVSITGGSPPFAYSWNNAQSGASLFGLNAGTYTVTVSDGFNCSVVGSANILQPSEIQINIQTTPDTSGVGTGTASAAVSGGVAPYSYIWSNGQTTSSIGGLSAGNYAVTIADNNGCSNTQGFNVSLVIGISELEEGVLKLYPNPSDGMLFLEIALNEKSDLSIEVFNVMGKKVYSSALSAWSNEKIPVNLSLLPSGSYYLKIHTQEFTFNKKLVKTD